MKRTLLSIIVILAASLVLGHGVKIDVSLNSPAVILNCGYDGGEAISYAEVLIYSPTDSETEYQNGRTDSEGKFAFIPNAAGTWKFAVDDGMGHMEEIKILIESSFLNISSEETKAGKSINNKSVVDNSVIKNIPLIYKLIFGLGIIFGITGLAFWAKARKALNVEAGK
jgi:nickel transport protein